MTGNMPQYDFGASYKVIVDDFLLRYLAVETATLELNLVSRCIWYMMLCIYVVICIVYAAVGLLIYSHIIIYSAYIS